MRSLLLLLFATTAAAQTCTPNATQQAAHQALSLRQKLLAASSPQMDAGVPASIKPLLHEFKQVLLRTVDTALTCNNPDPTQIEPGLVALLHANQPEKPFVKAANQDDDKPDLGDYGDNLTLKVAPIIRQPGLYSIQLTSSISCGSDSMLLLYRRTAQGYRRELAWFNPDLNSSADAYGDLYEWSLVPGPDGSTLFAGIHGTPYCTSRMSGFKLDLISLATSNSPQKHLAHEEHYYSRDSDRPTNFHETSDGFEFHVDADSLDFTQLFTRPRVYRFRTTEGRLSRIQPIADNARDFVDAWLQLPWSEAAHWTAGRQLQTFHDSTKGATYGPVRACGGNLYQVQLGPGDGASSDEQPVYYVEVKRSLSAFTVMAAPTKANPACKGPNLIPIK